MTHIILKCVQINKTFWDGYNILQEFLHYDKYETYGEAEKFINRIISKLVFSEDEMLIKVAENTNSHIDKVINASYGYRNFKRFRAEVMLILTYNNKRGRIG